MGDTHMSDDVKVKALVGQLMSEIHASTQEGMRITCININPDMLRCITQNLEFLGLTDSVAIYCESGVKIRYGNLYLEFYEFHDLQQEEGKQPYQIIFCN